MINSDHSLHPDLQGLDKLTLHTQTYFIHRPYRPTSYTDHTELLHTQTIQTYFIHRPYRPTSYTDLLYFIHIPTSYTDHTDLLHAQTYFIHRPTSYTDLLHTQTYFIHSANIVLTGVTT